MFMTQILVVNARSVFHFGHSLMEGPLDYINRVYVARIFFRILNILSRNRCFHLINGKFLRLVTYHQDIWKLDLTLNFNRTKKEKSNLSIFIIHCTDGIKLIQIIHMLMQAII